MRKQNRGYESLLDTFPALLPLAALIAIVFLAFLTQTVTGFGAMLIAMALGAFLFPVQQLLAWFLPLVITLSTYLVIRHWRSIDFSLLLKAILPGMTAGLLLGQVLFWNLEADALKKLLGVMIAALALRELLKSPSAETKTTPLLPWSVAAGFVHGIFATGGPVLVYALNTQKLDKGSFRSTLAMVWLIMGIALCIPLMSEGALSGDDLPVIALLIGVLTISIVIGEWLHHRVNAALFTRSIQLLLVVAGVMLCFQ